MSLILYIEDDEDSVILVQKVLEARGHNVSWGFNGNEGLDLAMLYPDLILLDIRLPDLSGYEVARRLRSSGHNMLKHVPIIALTAYGKIAEEKVKAHQSGCNTIMSKPINIHELVHVVETQIANSIKHGEINLQAR